MIGLTLERFLRIFYGKAHCCLTCRFYYTQECLPVKWGAVDNLLEKTENKTYVGSGCNDWRKITKRD